MNAKNTNSFDWSSIEPETRFVKFDGKPLKLKFQGDPVRVTRTIEGEEKEQFDFIVIDQADKQEKTLSVSSIRLMLRLKDQRPLAGKILEIERIGNGFDTTYKVMGLP